MNSDIKFVLSASKLDMSEDDIAYIGECITKKTVSMERLLYYCIHNKTSSLVWRNLNKLRLVQHIESSVIRTFKYIHDATQARNSELMKEVFVILP